MKAASAATFFLLAALAASGVPKAGGAGGNAAPPPTVMWAKDVAPLVYQSCAECHRPGGPGPFSLLTYADARPRARQIAQVTASRFMPPWLPTAGSGPFVHARRLTDAQVAVFRLWAAQGAPLGAARDLPTPPRFAGGWHLGTPDQIVSMPKPYTLPAETTSPYRCFVLPLALPADERLRAIEFRPGNPAVVRHATLYADPTGAARRLAAQSGAVGYAAQRAGLGPDVQPLAEWSVGADPYVLPEGVAARLPAGADLVLLLRFQPDGQPEQVRSEVGLYLAPPTPATPPTILTLGLRDLILRPGQKATLTDTFTLPVAVRLLRVTPHAHPIFRTLQVTAGGHSLLQINDWNANWQASYPFAAPPFLPAGTRLIALWTADNTAANPRNPASPPMSALPGLSYLDDMATVRLELVPADPADAPALLKAVRAPRRAPDLQTTAADRHG